ncbi:precorrin-3B synthase [Streptomyces sp. NPDC058372]|uniref:precorrin-3B synthase n=1 Tax=Streptomyces sp. NPDC058372 TaxID=3346464 RepID=UPI00366002BB
MPTPAPGDACPGALRLHEAADGHLARIRIPGGLIPAEAATALARAAEELGDGNLDLTSRGNVQLRGLPADAGTELAARLTEAGLLPAPSHERMRNIVASPLSGLDDTGHVDVTALVTRLDAVLCADPATAALSGRFLFGFDDGRGDTAALDADVTMLATPDGDLALTLPGVAGSLRVPPGQAPAAAHAAALLFLDAARASTARAWRVVELPPAQALSTATLTELAARVPGARTAPAPETPAPSGGPRPGPTPPREGRSALHALAPLGRLTTAQWRELADLAAAHGSGTLRATPWRGIVVPGLTPARAAQAAADLARAGLVTGAASPWEGVGACTGRPGCVKSLADVRADARAALDAAPGGLPVYWSGCERRCGHPRGTAWVDAVATGAGYDVAVRPADPAADPRPAGRNVPAARLPVALAAARRFSPTTRPTRHDAVRKEREQSV